MVLKKINAKTRLKKVRKAVGGKTPAVKRGPNVNEQRFNRMCLNGVGSFEPMKIEVTNLGSVYTPDFCYAGPDLGSGSRLCFIEVKMKHYRSAKDQKLIRDRSRLAWEIAAERYPHCDFVWADYDKGAYECELTTGRGDSIKKVCRTNADFEDLLRGKGVE